METRRKEALLKELVSLVGEPQSFETICPTCQTPREEGCDAPAE